MMSTAGKRCYYEVLGLTQDCSADEIRSAYKKLALQRHPDKLIQSGLSSDDATASFQELVHAYEVLSDPKERKWYDSHRSQILFSDLSSPSNSSDSIGIPNLFSYFSTSCYTDYSDSKKGFYRVYGEVFDKVFKNEVNYARKLGLGLGGLKEAPLMGDLKSPYSQVNAFYGYWLGFCTVMDFGWVDKWDCDAGGNRKTRRLMEEDNKKIRKKAKREFNETVRGLAEFVKKRDKRVIDMMVRKETEREKKREEELARKKEMERQRMEKARTYEEPEWTKVEEVEYDGEDAEREEEEELKEWYCVVCSKKFKSEKQWKNHEQSKKHKEKVAELKASFDDEDDVGEIESEEAKAEEDVDDNISNGRFNSCFQSEVGEIESEEAKAEEDVDDNVSNGRFNSCFQSEVGGVSELETEFRDGMRIEVEETGDKLVTEPEGERSDVDDVNPSEELKFDKSDDDGSSILEAMLSGRKNKKLGRWGPQSNLDSNNDEELEFTEYNKVKVKKGRRAKGGKTKHVDGEALRASNGNSNSLNMEATAKDDSQIVNDLVNVESNVDGRDNIKSKADKKNTEAEMKKASKGRKQKAKTKHSTLECEKCGVGFDSRNKLHKHLNETGHASLNLR